MSEQNLVSHDVGSSQIPVPAINAGGSGLPRPQAPPEPTQPAIVEVNPGGTAPSFNGTDSSLIPATGSMRHRSAYYHLVNMEEHPELLPLAYDLATEQLRAAESRFPELAGSDLESLAEKLTALAGQFVRPWLQATEDLTRRQALHYFVQYMPTALVDGCFLQAGLRVSTAHTRVGSALTGLYQHQVRAFVADPGRHFVADYQAVYTRLGSPVEEVSSHSFAERGDFLEHTFEFPIFLLAIGQLPRTFSAEIVGINLAWHFLGLVSFGPDLIADTSRAYGLPSFGDDLSDPLHFEKGRERARDAARRLFDGVSGQQAREVWSRLLRGVTAALALWTDWFERTQKFAPAGAPDPRQEMIDLLWRKAPHASGYHGNRRLGANRIDELLDPKAFDGARVLEALAASPWIKSGKSGKSALLSRLIGFGGPMLAVFTPVEQQIIQNWIDTVLPPGGAPAAGATTPTPSTAAAAPTAREERHVSGRMWEPKQFATRSERLYGKSSIRDLYHHLVNIEFHPGILPVAERFAHDRLERSMAMLWKGERPIPSRHYDPAALESWVYKKHREQVDSYRPPEQRKDVPKEAFIEATVQLAPLILIDGGWLQGMASPALIHTTVGRMLFHVLVEEIGEGNPREHHANVYRDLLRAMGVNPPSVESREFADWTRLQDASFEVPTLWLAISCFPRHFLPEILGLNLAVELAGVGGPYMEARDTLRRFKYPTLFVDVHNAADNVSVGHSAWAMNAIKRYMDQVSEREGPHNVDRVWHRVWTGVRATLPQIGRMRLLAHRLQQRLFGEDPRLVPLIFPS